MCQFDIDRRSIVDYDHLLPKACSKQISNELGKAVLSAFEEIRRIKEQYPELCFDGTVYTSNEEAVVELSSISEFRLSVDEGDEVVIDVTRQGFQQTKKYDWKPSHFPISHKLNVIMHSTIKDRVMYLTLEPYGETPRHTSVHYIFYNGRQIRRLQSHVGEGPSIGYFIPQPGEEIIIEITTRTSWKIINDSINHTISYSHVCHETTLGDSRRITKTAREHHGVYNLESRYLRTLDPRFNAITVQKSNSKAKSKGFFHRFRKRLWG